jgi:hypothetical protein
MKGSIQAKEIELELDGASHASFVGAANDAKFHLSGSSTLDLPGLTLQNAEVELSGASRATIDAKGKLKYDLSSASSLKYLGEPKTLEGSKTGASSISRRR